MADGPRELLVDLGSQRKYPKFAEGFLRLLNVVDGPMQMGSEGY